MSQVCMRLFVQYHVTSFGNTLLHTEGWGTKAYNRNIQSVNSRLYHNVTFGEGCHNYHHVFPYDYKCAENGYSNINFAALFIELMAKFGWAYDLKQPSKELVKINWEKQGDGTHHLLNEKNSPNSIENEQK
ncbi:acyl-CoA Delta(11) desaturase-like [Leptopilina heterotoma]|uniref:acyl-CoA Delta(11) desaturase-like n=1 Tax=Leptopilina heterotoma TaxID=63436 RepID=UPI001CA89A77|nr:acyl-CoA Delta(11) desaturase-like [Leptopilina heterotoma]